MPGVRAVITVARPGRGGHQEHAGGGGQNIATVRRRPGRRSGRWRPIAFAMSANRSRWSWRRPAKQAKDAAEAIFADIDPLPAVTTASAAAAPDAPLLHDEAPGNLCLDFHYGDIEKVAAAFAQAAHVTKLSMRNNRIVVCPMEPRSAIGEYDAESDRFILRLGCQGVFGQRNLVSGILGVPVEKLRVLTGNVGGSFGMKASAYPEYICLLHAARTLGQPVKWTDERSESFMSDSHGRDHEMTVGTGAGRRRQISGAAGDRLRQSRRLAEQCDDHSAHDEHGEEHHRRLRHAADRGLDEMHVHQHHAGRRLSRRRAAGRQLLHGAAGRNRRARDGHRSR